MTEEHEKAQGLLASGDITGLLRQLRAHGETLPLVEVARLVVGAARLAGFDDLTQAAAVVAESGDGSAPQALYDFGYACSERGAGHLAVRPLVHALELAPDAAPVLGELVAALEHDGQHARAVAVLEEHESVLQWLHRFQYVYNALMAGWTRQRRVSDGCPTRRTPRGGRHVKRCGACSPAPQSRAP